MKIKILSLISLAFIIGSCNTDSTNTEYIDTTYNSHNVNVDTNSIISLPVDSANSRLVETPKNNKFAFVVIYVEEPYLYYSYSDYQLPPTELAYAKWKNKVYYTKVNEFKIWNEELEYRLMDEAEVGVAEQPTEYIFDIESKVQDAKTKRELMNEKTKVKSSKVMVFDTYKEASISRKQLEENPEKYSTKQ
jgi:hypothetical protein